MAELTADFELGTNGNNVLAADPGSATAWNVIDVPGGTLTYDNTHVGHGSLAAEVAAVSGFRCCAKWTTAFGTQTDHYGRFYVYLTAYPASAGGFLSVFSGASIAFTIRINSTGKLLGVDGTGTAYTFTNAVSLNQVVRIEYHVIHSATVGQHELKLFNSAESTTATETQTSAANRNTRADANDLRFGVGEGGLSTYTYWMDDIVANATAYPGPVAASAPSAAMAGAFVPAILQLIGEQ